MKKSRPPALQLALATPSDRRKARAPVKLLAIDMLTPELSIGKRPPDFEYPVHRTLLRDGVLIAESVAGARPLAGGRAELMFLPLNIVGADGAPARVLGRPVKD